MATNFTELAFTASVRKMQKDYETRELYAKFEAKSPARNLLTPREKQFVARRDGFYLSSVGESGWPYVQFRGGPPGFLKVLVNNTLAFADFRGNGQFITAGNFESDGKAVLFLMNYAKRQRLKIWAYATVMRAADHPDLLEEVLMPDYDAAVERIFSLKVEAFDWNCPQHITQRYTLAEVKEAIEIDPDLLRSCCPDTN